jgi:hypothetical protein
MKIQIKLSKKELVNALGAGVREIAIANGKGFQRQTAVHKSKKIYSRKGKNNGQYN